MDTTISSKEAKTAREVLGLPQAKVALAVNLNRSYLSQFENGRYLLTDNDNNKLRLFYENEGYDFNDPANFVAQDESLDVEIMDGERVHDGFVISGFIPPDEAEELIAEYQLNEIRIDDLCAYKLRANHTTEPLLSEPYIDGDTHHNKTREVLILMARNYNIVQFLQDGEYCKPLSNFLDANSTGEFVGLEFGKLLN